MLKTIKPKNARSKRALAAREPQEVEPAKTAVFVKGPHAGEKVIGALKDLMALKRPDAVSYSKKSKNADGVHPFEDSTTLERWAKKSDASLFVIGQSSKKRPDGLTVVRMFDGTPLEICEFGVTKFAGMADYKSPKSTPGHRPLMHFASELFDTHPRYSQVKSLLLDMFGGAQIDSIHLAGIEHIISVTLSPTPPSLSTSSETPDSELPAVHIRTYTLTLLASGSRVPRVELVPMGPSLDLALRRHSLPDPDRLARAMKRPKLAKKDVESGLGKKRKNAQVDEMGDLRGRIHVGSQDLSRLQTRKMKGLKERDSDGRSKRRKVQADSESGSD